MKRYIVATILLMVGAGCTKVVPETQRAGDAGDPLSICSFNIRLLGLYKKKDGVALASILAATTSSSFRSW